MKVRHILYFLGAVALIAIWGCVASCNNDTPPKPDCPPDAKYCPAPPAESPQEFGNAPLGQLLESVSAEVMLYDHGLKKLTSRKMDIPSGTWILPGEAVQIEEAR